MMLPFIFSHLRNNITRSALICIGILISFLVSISTHFLYINTIRIFEYYSIWDVNQDRFEVTKEGWGVLSLLHKDSASIDDSIQTMIAEDDSIQWWYWFTLVELPVVVTMNIFSFTLETDVPVFAVSDNYFCKNETTCSLENHMPIGISRLLFDFYNTNLAGSAQFFPRFPEWILKWQSMEFSFWTSKIFDYKLPNPSILTWVVQKIEWDLPWFGITLPRSSVEKSMNALGFYIGKPYKIIWYIEHGVSPESIREKYKKHGVNVLFDSDKTENIHKKLSLYQTLLLSVSIINSLFFYILIGFLLTGFIREITPFLEYLRRIGVNTRKAFGFITLYTWILSIWAISIGIVCIIGSNLFLLPKFVSIIENIGISTGIIPISLSFMGLYWVGHIVAIILIGHILSYKIISRKWENMK